MMTVNEVGKITGVSIRTLHYYDQIGLLTPADITESGYRLYDDTSLERLQQIMMFRELEFPLKEIKQILDSPEFDRGKALEQQIDLLELRCEHLKKLAALAREIKDKGEKVMKFEAFDKQKIKEYEAEAKAKWGNTDAYKEYEQNTEGAYNADIGLMKIFEEFGKYKELPPNNPEVKKLVDKLQNYITENYYKCTDVILISLGEIYASDERFAENINKAGGKGTAAFVRKAIKSAKE